VAGLHILHVEISVDVLSDTELSELSRDLLDLGVALLGRSLVFGAGLVDKLLMGLNLLQSETKALDLEVATGILAPLGEAKSSMSKLQTKSLLTLLELMSSLKLLKKLLLEITKSCPAGLDGFDVLVQLGKVLRLVLIKLRLRINNVIQLVARKLGLVFSTKDLSTKSVIVGDHGLVVSLTLSSVTLKKSKLSQSISDALDLTTSAEVLLLAVEPEGDLGEHIVVLTGLKQDLSAKLLTSKVVLVDSLLGSSKIGETSKLLINPGFVIRNGLTLSSILMLKGGLRVLGVLKEVRADLSLILASEQVSTDLLQSDNIVLSDEALLLLESSKDRQLSGGFSNAVDILTSLQVLLTSSNPGSNTLVLVVVLLGEHTGLFSVDLTSKMIVVDLLLGLSSHTASSKALIHLSKMSLNSSTEFRAVKVTLGELHNRVLISVRREVAAE